MAVTSILSVAVDKDEYSKFEPENAVIGVRIRVEGASDTLTVELRKARRGRTVSVASKTVTIAANSTSTTLHTVSFDTRTDAIDSTGLYNLIRRGDYYIYVRTNSTISSTLSSDAASNTEALVLADSSSFPSTGQVIINSSGSTKETIKYTANNTDTDTLTLYEGLSFSHSTGETVALYNVTGQSVDFEINLITAKGLRDTYLFGIDLQSSDLRMPKHQPRQVTGVEVKEVSRNHKMAFFPLNYQVIGDDKYLSWDNGELVLLDTSYADYILPAGGVGAEFISITVDHDLLPTETKQESLLIDELKIDDATIRKYIKRATDQIEFTSLQVYLEPTQLVTDIDASEISYTGDSSAVVINNDYDFVETPITFYPRQDGQWIGIQFPFVKVIDVEELYGAVANTRVVHINTEWVEFSSHSGFTQLVPFNTELAFDFVGLVWVESLHGATPIPNFWHYNVVAGLKDLPGELMELIGKSAAIPILTVAGQAFRGGFSSQSISRDGVSESVSYTSSAIYGIYSATIEEYKNWIREGIVQFKNKYRGPMLMVA